MRYQNALVFGAAALAALADVARAQVFDLKNDWSDLANPNGAWSSLQGASLLPKVLNWQGGCGGGWASPQDGWAVTACSAKRIPFLFQSNGSETLTVDWLAGDIVVHSYDLASGGANGEFRLVWTSPKPGVVDVSGGVWMGRDIGRSNHWVLRHNGASITEGDIGSGDVYSRASPMFFSLGSGGAGAVADIAVATGDTIALDIVRTSSFGDFVGIELTITLEPSCYADCEEDGDLDVFDFLCFQGEFASQAAYADCEQDGDWDVFDFLCFQGHFANGCN